MGKLLYGFGDSLVDGHCIHEGMLDALAKKYKLTYRKYAANGATIIPDKTVSGKDVIQKGYWIPDIAAQIVMAPEELPDFLCLRSQNAYQR